MTQLCYRCALVLAGLLLTAPSALAHHPMGGKTPSTVFEGLLSGLGHPIIGVDHFIFTLGVGLAAMIAGRLKSLPLFFVGFTIVGALLHVNGFGLPFAELFILASVFAVGAFLVVRPNIPASVWASTFAAAGLFHGYAYGEAIFGSEATPLLAYLLGFGCIQYAIAVCAGALTKLLTTSHETAARIGGGGLIGAAVALSGGPLAFLVN
ncbi:MAG: HupE/UreJ family protein [Sphingomonadales bacterium]